MSLYLEINSFSYKKGIPEDSNGNGGGYVFDCRGILNPGRVDVYKYLTGKDQTVIDFLERETSMPFFMEQVQKLVDMNVENYLQRGFQHLQVSFGCTGGQHRSVYAAEKLSKHIKDTFSDVTVELHHTNSENWHV